jgi:hypothetical protein
MKIGDPPSYPYTSVSVPGDSSWSICLCQSKYLLFVMSLWNPIQRNLHTECLMYPQQQSITLNVLAFFVFLSRSSRPSYLNIIEPLESWRARFPLHMNLYAPIYAHMCPYIHSYARSHMMLYNQHAASHQSDKPPRTHHL